MLVLLIENWTSLGVYLWLKYWATLESGCHFWLDYWTIFSKEVVHYSNPKCNNILYFILKILPIFYSCLHL